MVSEMNAEKIANTLRELRTNKKATLEEVAEACGITASALANYESGIRIPRDTVKIALANYYKKTVSAIFFT